MGLGSLLGLIGGVAGAPFTGGASMIPMIAKTGLGIAGSMLGARAHNQPEKWRQKIIEQEMARRNMMQGMAAPSLLGSLGYRNPSRISAMSQQIGQGGAPSPKFGGKK